MENLLCGLQAHEQIIYDLKGSQINRLASPDSFVQLDTNFLQRQRGRPLSLTKVQHNLLRKSINNDTSLLMKSNIVDYSLLVVIDRKLGSARFGIIDYLQQYNLTKLAESKLKIVQNLGSRPTIISPQQYRLRFCLFFKLYFIGVTTHTIDESSEQICKEEIQLEASDKSTLPFR